MAERRSYSPEFRRDAVRMLRNGSRSPRELAAELGCSEAALRKWQRELLDDETVDGSRDGEATAAATAGPAQRTGATIGDVLARRAWVVIAVTAIAILAAWAYSLTVPARYQATATVLAHPAASVTRASDYSTDLSLLSYGSLEQTFVGLARSARLRDQAAAGTGLSRTTGNDYSAVANVLPSSTVLEISVAGPDRNAVVPFANTLAADVSSATRRYFPIFTLTPLDRAIAPSSQIEPRTRQNVLVGLVAGLIVGFGIAVLSLRVRGVPDWRVPDLRRRLQRRRA
jgi:capsular polysaccharide biosynthesis protein